MNKKLIPAGILLAQLAQQLPAVEVLVDIIRIAENPGQSSQSLSLDELQWVSSETGDETPEPLVPTNCLVGVAIDVLSAKPSRSTGEPYNIGSAPALKRALQQAGLIYHLGWNDSRIVWFIVAPGTELTDMQKGIEILRKYSLAYFRPDIGGGMGELMMGEGRQS